MDVTLPFSHDVLERTDFHKFLQDGLQDVYHNDLLDFEQAFDELEKGYSAYD